MHTFYAIFIWACTLMMAVERTLKCFLLQYNLLCFSCVFIMCFRIINKKKTINMTIFVTVFGEDECIIIGQMMSRRRE